MKRIDQSQFNVYIDDSFKEQKTQKKTKIIIKKKKKTTTTYLLMPNVSCILRILNV